MTSHHEITCPSCRTRLTVDVGTSVRVDALPAPSRPDIVDEFLRANPLTPTDAAFTSGELFAAFEAWADDRTGDHGMTPRRLSAALLKRGWTFEKLRGERRYSRPAPQGVAERHDRGTVRGAWADHDRLTAEQVPDPDPRSPSGATIHTAFGGAVRTLRTFREFLHGLRFRAIVNACQGGEPDGFITDDVVERALLAEGWSPRPDDTVAADLAVRWYAPPAREVRPAAPRERIPVADEVIHATLDEYGDQLDGRRFSAIVAACQGADEAPQEWGRITFSAVEGVLRARGWTIAPDQETVPGAAKRWSRPLSGNFARPRLHPSIIDPDLMVGAYLGTLSAPPFKLSTLFAGFNAYAGERANMVSDDRFVANLESNGWTERSTPDGDKWFPPARTPGPLLG